MALNDIVVNLNANTSKFNKGMEQSESRLKQFGKSVVSVSANVLAFGGAMATAAAGGMAVLVKKQFETIGALGQTASRLGIATDKLSELQFAARLVGADTELMNASLQSMVERVSEAAIGSGEGAEALKELGLSAQSLNELSPDEQFRTLADAIQGVQNPSDQLRLAIKMFGDEGTRLLPLLKGGSEGLDKMADGAKKTGASLDGIDVAKVNMANAAVSKLGAVFDGIISQLAIQLAPLIEVVADKIAVWVGDTTGGGDKMFNAFELVASGVGIVADVIHNVKVHFKGMQAIATQAVGYIIQALSKLAGTIQKIANALGMDLSIGDWAKGVVEEFDIMTAEMGMKWHKEFLKDPPSIAIKKTFDEIARESEARAKQIAEDAKKQNDFRLPSTAMPEIKDEKKVEKQLEEKLEAPQLRIAEAVEADSVEGAKRVIAATANGRAEKNKAEEATAKNTGDLVAGVRELNITNRRIADKQPRFKPVRLG